PGQGASVALPRPGRGGSAKPRSRPARDARRSQFPPLPRRVLAAIRALPDHPLLDRVVRGRTWIAVLGVMLAGIVAMQIEVLKLGASIGRSLQSGTSLQSRNEQLRASVAQLGDDQRIERLAAAMGMVMPAPDGVGFVSVGPATVKQAIANIHQPDTQAFLSLSVPNGAVTGASPAPGTLGASAATTGSLSAAGSPSASTPTTGAASPSAISGQTTQTAAAATSPATPTQLVAPATPVPAPTTSPASASTGAVGTAAPAPTQSASPTAATGGAGVPAAG
ncbi:MAG: hypothetical protein M3Z06_00310, partial [Actinomycetota bacterium]|nr:hypothetical protein [Actinomycetota bacterium]